MRSWFFILCCFSPFISYGQVQDSLRVPDWNREVKEIGIIGGISAFKHAFFELGIAKVKWREGCLWSSYYRGLSLSAEYNPFSNRGGVLLSLWNSLPQGLSYGINLNSYSDFQKLNLGIRPMIGFGGQNVQLVYGRNFNIINHHINGLNKHVISLRVFFKIKELK